MTAMSALRKLLHTLVGILLVPVLLFEEWGWNPLAAQVAKLARLPLWARLEHRLRTMPPWGAVLVFLVPVLLLLPVKLLALLLFGNGHYASGVALLAGAKLVGTAMVARIFQLVQPALMHLPWFALWYPRWTAWKNQWLGIVRRSAPWRAVRRWRAGTRRRWRVFCRGFWRVS
jgi:hypothetical protein